MTNETYTRRRIIRTASAAAVTVGLAGCGEPNGETETEPEGGAEETPAEDDGLGDETETTEEGALGNETETTEEGMLGNETETTEEGVLGNETETTEEEVAGNETETTEEGALAEETETEAGARGAGDDGEGRGAETVGGGEVTTTF